VSETAHLAVDAPVAPARVFGVEAQHQSVKLRGCGRSSSPRHGWLGPPSSYETAVPANHCRRFHDQHHLVEAAPVERPREYGEYGPVGGGEPRPIDLSLQDQDLMAKGEDLCVTSITGHQQQPETGNQETEQMCKER
jgi:hypothetical protein